MKRNDRAIVGLVTVAHAMVHTYELSIPVFVPIWLSTFSVTPFELSLVVTAGFALFGLGALPAGVLADVMSARTLIVGCLVGMGLGFLALVVAPGPVGIALALVIWGAAASVYHPSGLSLISRGVEARGSAFAYHGMAGNLGIALGPLATTVLLVFLDWRLVAGLLALPAAVAVVYALSVDIDERAAVEEAATDGGEQDGVRSLGEFLSTSKTLLASSFIAVFVVVVMSGTYYRGVLTFLPELLGDVAALTPIDFYGRELTPGNYVYTGLLMVGIAGQYTAGKLTDRMRPEYGIVAGFTGLALVSLLIGPAFSAGLPMLLGVCALLGFFLFSVQPFYQATVAEYTPASARGLSYGYTYVGTFGVGAAGGVVAGALLTYADPATLFAALSAIALVAVAVGAVLVSRGSPN